MSDQKRILIVEDDEGIARVLADNLKIDGFNVLWAPTAHDALVGSQSFRPDLVLLDVMLAGQPHGFEICGVLRQGGRCGVIIVSARSQREDKLRGLGVGADDYVTKPFDMEELAARINAVLRRTVLVVSRIRLGEIEVDFRSPLRPAQLDPGPFDPSRVRDSALPGGASGPRCSSHRVAARGVGDCGRLDDALGRLCDFATAQEDRAESAGAAVPANRSWRRLLAHD
jgi:CheY-like chemotaxis protein